MKRVQGMMVSRLLIVLFWVAAIFGFLFLPSFYRLFYERKSISIFVWPMIVDSKVLNDFERQTGIKVYVNYYESPSELYSKLKATEGEGYDLITPSDYLVERLIQEGLVQKIDKPKLPFFGDVHPYLQGHYFDPHNDYSIPYYMGVFGLGINKYYVKEDLADAGWGWLFDQKQARYPICMTDDPRQAIMLTTYYLYRSIDALKEVKNQQAIKDLLIKQKQWVHVYTDSRVEEVLASGSCPVAFGLSSDVWKIMKEYEDIAFVIPPGKMFVGMESFVIPKKSQKTDLIYQFLNFLYDPEIIRANSLMYGFCPPLKTVSVESEKILCITDDDIPRIEFFRNIVPEALLQKFWISIMAH